MKKPRINNAQALLDEQLSAYGLEGMFNGGEEHSSMGVGVATPAPDGINRYQLGIDGVSAPLSILRIEGYEGLSEPWRYAVQFTAPHGLSMAQILSRNAAIALVAEGENDLINALAGMSSTLREAFSAFETPLNRAAGALGLRVSNDTRVLYGVVTAFSQLSCSADEARYEVTVSPRLQLLDNTCGSAIYQQQTVPQVVEAVLRKHELTGVDFRFELADSYPVKEYISQWQESDLTFIRRILADSGIWFRFDSNTEHGCDVVVFGDSVQQYQDGPQVNYRPPSGQNDGALEAVWEMTVARKTVPQRVVTQDYNYRAAQTGMRSEVNEQKRDITTRGQHYLYGEHYRERGEEIANRNEQDALLGQFGNRLEGLGELPGELPGIGPLNAVGSSVRDGIGKAKGALDGAIGKGAEKLKPFGADEDYSASDDSMMPELVGQGAWYGKLRHQRLLTEQVTISGKTTLSQLTPGQILTVSDAPIAEAASGILIVSVESSGDRKQAYQLSFTGIPYDALRPYRPALLPWPTIGGTLPARVTSPANDRYGYMDNHGRYRVKMDFDLNDSWRKGEESLWLRRASVYAGDTYGLHFPLIDGTEVAIAFNGGNPDRPYIAHAMHDSRHPELVTVANHKRNVIRTPANNKLRMDDERGKEHIKLATEYGKTQLNIGHLVDAERKQRGEGFELRTDEWGAIRAEKGLFITADGQPKAKGEVREMEPAMNLLASAYAQMQGLNHAAEQAQALVAEIAAQKALIEQRLKALNAQVLLASAPAGVGIVSGEDMQLASGSNLYVNAGKNADVGVVKKLTVAVGEGASLYSRQGGIKALASAGKVDIQAQSDGMGLASKQDMEIASVEGKLSVAATKELILACGGAYIKLSGGGIELGCPKNVTVKSIALQKMGPARMNKEGKPMPVVTYRYQPMMTKKFDFSI